MTPKISPANSPPHPFHPVSTDGRFQKKMAHSWIITFFLFLFFKAFPLLAQYSVFFNYSIVTFSGRLLSLIWCWYMVMVTKRGRSDIGFTWWCSCSAQGGQHLFSESAWGTGTTQCWCQTKTQLLTEHVALGWGHYCLYLTEVMPQIMMPLSDVFLFTVQVWKNICTLFMLRSTAVSHCAKGWSCSAGWKGFAGSFTIS